jgi:cobalt-zinc-cadmium efflux system membrane fusion protein
MTDVVTPRSGRRPIAWLLARLPNALVLLLLLAVGLWGHHTGWEAPRFSTLFGEAPAASEDWCAEHNVPESTCLACHPELAGESPTDWCKEHGVPESKCTICHPEILATGIADDWCKEHGVPESGCTICHPEIARRGEVADDESLPIVTAAEDIAPAGPPKPGKDPTTCQKHALKVQFASKEAMDKAGVGLGKVIERPMAEAIAVPAHVDYDRTHYAKVMSRVTGTARYLGRQLGDTVAAGDVLALIDAAEVGLAKAELLQAFAANEVAIANEKRLERFVAEGFGKDTDRIQASAVAREAAIRLFHAQQDIRNLGLPLPEGAATPESVAALGVPEAILKQLTEADRSANLLPLRAPLAGIVVGRDLVYGDTVDTTRILFEIADTQRMWVLMDVPQLLSSRIVLGARMLLRPDHARGEPVAGQVDWISTAVDDVTRTLQARAMVDNADGVLRANTFGKAQIVIRPTTKVIAVPSAAVQWEGCCHVVFVRLADTVFQTRKVRIGTRDAAFTEVLVGLLPGEVVVTAASHVLLAEILKSNLGAGCCGDK